MIRLENGLVGKKIICISYNVQKKAICSSNLEKYLYYRGSPND